MKKSQENPQYQISIDLNVLEHLGINLYSNVSAVLTEVVANAWDADASNVQIRIDPKHQWMEIEDNGVGMSIDELNNKYLRVGYRRRDEDAEFGCKTAKGRSVMGRKGLGKLSLFSIADIIEVQSAKNGCNQGFIMNAVDIKRSAEEKTTYHPTPLTKEELNITQGTKITLRNIKRQRLDISINALRKRLARRFSIINASNDFEITIDNIPVSPSDRIDLFKAQFIWQFGETKTTDNDCYIMESGSLTDRLNEWDPAWRVRGWIGTVRKPKDLDDSEAGNLNGIVVFARGRLFHENILDKLNDSRLYTKYLTGQIEADFLDSDDQPDIATSDRQRIQEDDPRYAQLIAFLRKQLSIIESKWNEWRKKHEVESAKKSSPALKEWLDTLQNSYRDSAETLISKLSSLPLDNEDDRKLLYKHGILAFERMKLHGSTENFVTHIHTVDKLLSILADRDSLESSLYLDIVRSRLDAILAFQRIVDDDEKEKVLQQYLFDHLWLLDPSWDRAAAGTAVMESRLKEEGIVIGDLTRKEELGRVDIKYRTAAGKHIIIELKKVSRTMRLNDLSSQGQTYVDKLKKILLVQGDNSPDIEVIFVIGKPVEEEKTNPQRLKALMDAVSPGSRIIHYDTLINNAQEAYSDYIEKNKKIDNLEKIINKI